MDFSLGIMAFNGLTKTSDFVIAYAILIMGFLIGSLLKKSGQQGQFIKIPQVEKKYWDILILFGLALVVLRNAPNFFIAGLITLVGLILYFALRAINQSQGTTWFYLSTSFLLINLKIFDNTQDILTILIINFAFIVGYRIYGINFLITTAFCFILKYMNDGQFLIVDSFHQAEHFLAYKLSQQGVNIFPNLGIFEEWMPNFFAEFINSISPKYYLISLGTARYLTSFILNFCILLLLYRRNIIFSIIIFLILPADRVSLLFAIFFALLLLKLNDHKKLLLLAWSVTPLIAFTLSPAYYAIILLGLVGSYIKNKIPFLNLIGIFLIWWLIFYLNLELFLNYIKIYVSLASNNLAAHGTPLFPIVWNLNDLNGIYLSGTALLRLGFIFIIGLLFGKYLKDVQKSQTLFNDGICLLGVLLSLYLFMQYSLTRIDSVGLSRLFPLGIGLIIILAQIGSGFNWKIMGSILIFYFWCAFSSLPIDFSLKLTKDSFSFRASQAYYTLSEKNLELTRLIELHDQGSGLILFSNEPALTIFMANAITPPFTSPWVATGDLPQEININFFRNNQKIIYLGKSWGTHDEVDIRARSPIIFKYLSHHYSLKSIDNFLFAIPILDSNKSPKIDSQLFSEFNLGKVSSYLAKNPSKYKTQIVNLDCKIYKNGSHQIINENNWFIADLNCGANLIPSIYFDGNFIKLAN